MLFYFVASKFHQFVRPILLNDVTMTIIGNDKAENKVLYRGVYSENIRNCYLKV